MRLGIRSMRVAFAAVLAAGAFLELRGATRATAEETWTLLPSSEWHDEFSPLYTNGQGLYCEGDPTQTADAPELVTYTLTDEETGEYGPIEAIKNEAVVCFKNTATPAEIRAVLAGLGLDILHAYYDPDATDPESHLAWFNVEASPTSAHWNDTGGLVAALRALPIVLRAGYSDVARVCGTPLYSNAEQQPNDPVFKLNATPSIRHASRMGLAGAWYSPDADLGDLTRQPSYVVVMDTGVDMDHPDLVGGHYLSPSGSRIGFGCAKKAAYFGTVRPFLPAPAQTNGENPIPAADAPAAPVQGVSADPCKLLDLKHFGHGHGTAMAGIVAAASNNGSGAVSASGDLAKFVSARLRMVAHEKVSVASAIPLVKKITAAFSLSASSGNVSNARTVYFGFATDAVKRTEVFDDLLDVMRKDGTKGVNDRLWIAPAANNAVGVVEPKLSFPACILKKKANADDTRSALPVVLGVTGVEYGPTSLVRAVEANWFSPRYTSGPQTGQFKPLDRRTYSISASTKADSLVDVREQWYGLRYTATAFVPADPSSGLKKVGYQHWDIGAPGNPALNGNAGSLEVYTGGYGTLLHASRRPNNLAYGNSVAAAHVAALAGALFAKFPSRKAADISLHIQRSQTSEGATHTETFGGHTYQIIEFDPVPTAPDPARRGRIPCPVDFLIALTTSPPSS